MPARSSRSEAPPLGQKITLYRKKRGLTMLQLAQAVGVTESYISFLESGVRSPSRKLLHKLVHFFYSQGNPALLDEWLVLAGFAPEHSPEGGSSPGLQENLEQHLSQNQEDLKAQFALIRHLIKQGELEEAKQRIQTCFQHFDGAVEVQSLVGTLELAKGNYANAIQAQQMALQFYEKNPQATCMLDRTDLLLSLGVSYFLSGYAQLQAAHRAEESTCPALQRSAKKDFVTAQQQFQQALDLDPHDIYIWDEYARVSFNLAHLSPSPKRWKTTIHAYQRVLKHRDNRVMGANALLEAALFLGHAHTKSGQYVKAEDILSLIQAIRPDYWLAHYARACLSSCRGESVDLDSALEHLARAIQLAPNADQARHEAQIDPDLEPVRRLRKAAFAHLMEGRSGR